MLNFISDASGELVHALAHTTDLAVPVQAPGSEADEGVTSQEPDQRESVLRRDAEQTTSEHCPGARNNGSERGGGRGTLLLARVNLDGRWATVSIGSVIVISPARP